MVKTATLPAIRHPFLLLFPVRPGHMAATTAFQARPGMRIRTKGLINHLANTLCSMRKFFQKPKTAGFNSWYRRTACMAENEGGRKKIRQSRMIAAAVLIFVKTMSPGERGRTATIGGNASVGI